MRILERKSEELECCLTVAEAENRARALAAACQDVDREEGRQALVKQTMKAELSRCESERGRLALVVARNKEPRMVETTVFVSPDGGYALTIRNDTGETVRSRPLSDAERQLPLLD